MTQYDIQPRRCRHLMMFRGALRVRQVSRGTAAHDLWRPSSLLLAHVPSRNDRVQQPIPASVSLIHSSARNESATIALAGAVVAVGAYGSRIVLNAWEVHQQAKYKEMAEEMYRQEQEERDNPTKKTKEEFSEGEANQGGSSDSDGKASSSGGGEAADTSNKPFDLDEFLANMGTKVKEFKMPSFSAADVEGMRYYKGGFENKMTRREAAQILGIRESADAKRIKTAHRKVLLANHPDKGGSPYMASKINEAKEMLIVGKE